MIVWGLMLLTLICGAACAADEEAPHIVFLGTGAADIRAPDECKCDNCTYIHEHGGKNRRRFSSLCVHPGIVIDFSELGMESLSACGIKPGDVSCLLITHSHGDHFNEAAIMSLAEARQKTAKDSLRVYGDPTVAAKLRAHSGRLGRTVPIEIVELKPYQEFEACGWKGKALAANHCADEEECLLYLLRRKGRALFYATDTTWFPVRTFYALQNEKLDMAIVEGTFGPWTEPEYLLVHMNFDFDRLIRRLMINQKALKPDGTFALTHLSPHACPAYDKLHEPMAKEGILIPYDGLKLPLGP